MDLQSQLTSAIDAKTVQAALANLSFLTLFGTLIFYWIQTSFSDFSFFWAKPVSVPPSPTRGWGQEASLPPIPTSGWEQDSRLENPVPNQRLGKEENQLNVSSFSRGLVGNEATPQTKLTPNPNQKTEDFLIGEEKGSNISPTTDANFPVSTITSSFDKWLPDNNSLASKPFSITVSTGMVTSNILLGLLLLLRWKESGHFPLSNLYESLMFLSWCFTLIHLVIENYTFSSSVSSTPAPTFFSSPSFSTEGWLGTGGSLFFRKNQKNQIPNLLGAITTPSALFTNAFATFTLPKEMQEAAPLVPALQSNWLMMHVTVMILSYAALIIGSLLSIAFLVVTLPKKSITTDNNSPKKTLSNTVGIQKEVNEGQSLSFILDNLSYRILGIGFPFLTIGILSGAVWANEAWGSYWSWDPKETWALLTWLIFAIYLHTRISKGWEGKKPAIIASFGFVVVWICYLGVNLIGEGLHSYGWFS
jgi:cytochrome c-type biogenesis protein CcsB